MKTSELIAAVGDDNVKIQVLDSCLMDAKYDIKAGTKITFGTNQPLTLEGTADFGLIVWMPRDAVAAVRNKMEHPTEPGLVRVKEQP